VNCLRCESELEKKVTMMDGEYAGERYRVPAETMVCPKCGHAALHASQIDAFSTAVADAYRKRHGLLTSSEIRKIRGDLGMSQEEFAAYLSVGLASVKRWELGKVQEKSMDDLVRIKCSLPTARRNVARLMLLKRGRKPKRAIQRNELGRKGARLAT
jgi:putative zinc finger/helix-turn-helix YgiT family protein